MTSNATRRLVVGITGASGAVYGIRALDLLREAGIETHLIISKAAQVTIAYETDISIDDIKQRAAVVHPVSDIGASIASGSFKTMGMLIAPCSIRTMSEIATGVTASLLTRAADVVLKERRRLVLAVRETPLHSGHLRNMLQLSDIGAVIAPIVPVMYTRPKTIADIVDHSVGRLIDLFGIEVPGLARWDGAPPVR